MRSITAWLLVATLGNLLLAPASTSGEGPPAASVSARPEAPDSAPRSEANETPAGPGATAEASPPAEATREALEGSTDAAATRAETLERLKGLGQDTDKLEAGASRALREVLEERLRWLDEWEKATRARHAAESPETSPEREVLALKSELEQVRALLDRAAEDPPILLPAAFQDQPGRTPEEARAEMKEAFAAAQAEAQQASLDHSEAEGSSGHAQAALRAERDKIHQRVATLSARREEREADLAAASTAEALELARERLINFEWEARVEGERLRGKEAQIALEDRREGVAEIRVALLEARRDLARRTLDAMRARVRELVDRKQGDLRRDVANEEGRAATAIDPLERYRARRNAELLELEARLLEDLRALSTGPEPSLEEQTELADRAEKDFAYLKQIVEDVRISALVALRLKHDYRRLPLERDEVARNDLARAAREMTVCEEELTAVELDLVDDPRADRILIEGLLEGLPPARRRAALAMAEPLEVRHRDLLNQRRSAREKLAERAQEIHRQVLRRFKTLEARYAYVRTHIFWMRDGEPIGRSTLAAVPREFRGVARSTLHLASAASDVSTWERPSVPFAVAALAAVALPLPLYRARRSLGGRPSPPRPVA